MDELGNYELKTYLVCGSVNENFVEFIFSLATSGLELVAELVVVGSDTCCIADTSSGCMVFGPGFPYKLGQFTFSY